MQCTPNVFHFGEQMFTMVCSAKHAPYLLGVGDKVKESSRWKRVVLIENKQKSWSSNLLKTEDQ